MMININCGVSTSAPRRPAGIKPFNIININNREHYQPKRALLHVDQASRDSIPKEDGERLSSAESKLAGRSGRHTSLAVQDPS